MWLAELRAYCYNVVYTEAQVACIYETVNESRETQ